ncbi:MAG: hypothetical protein Q9165_004220 [Trypethelium subeluteriae]
MSKLRAFSTRKDQILQKLAANESGLSDKSPKGSVDEQIVDLIQDINAIDGLVTTSSCSGRISVFLDSANRTRHAQISQKEADGAREEDILHIATASLEDTQRVLTAAISAGFRESGAVNFDSESDGTIAPMVAVRSTGLASDTVIGYQDHLGIPLSIVDESYLRALVSVANDCFLVNQERIERFRSAVKDIYNDSNHSSKRSSNRENRALRKDLKRAEGLQRQMMEVEKRGHEATGLETNAIDKDVYLSLERGLGLPE